MLLLHLMIKDNYIKELDTIPKVKAKNKVVRKFNRVSNKLKTANYKKYFYMKWAKIFK